MEDLLSRIPDLEREADVFEQQSDAFARKALALRQIIEGLRVLNGDAERLFGLRPAIEPEDTSAEEGPRGRDAVRAIVVTRAGDWFIRDLKRINREKGWPSNDNGIETAVLRMAKTGEAVKVPGRKGLYRFGAPALPRAVTSEGGAANEPRLDAELAA